MKKIFTLSLLISIMPYMCLGSSARYTQLVREKQRKMEELEKCLGATNGLKIAGVSTLGLTAIGVSTDIAQASKKKEYDKKIGKIDEKIETVKKEIAEKEVAVAEKKKREQLAAEKAAELEKQKRTLKYVVEQDAKNISSGNVKFGTSAILHGYQYAQLSENLKKQIKAATEVFVQKCYDLVQDENNHVESADAGYIDYNETSSTILDENTVLDNLIGNIFVTCKIGKCDNGFKEIANNCVDESKDCTNEARQENPYVELAVWENGVCKIKACDDLAELDEVDNVCIIKESEPDKDDKQPITTTINSRVLKDVVAADIASNQEIIKRGVKFGDKIITHGYIYTELPDEYYQKFVEFTSKLITGCAKLADDDNKTTSRPTTLTDWEIEKNYPKLSMDTVLENLDEHIVVGPCALASEYVPDEENCNKITTPLNYYSFSDKYVCREKDNTINVACTPYKPYEGINPGEWKVVFHEGIITGIGYCNHIGTKCFCDPVKHTNNTGSECNDIMSGTQEIIQIKSGDDCEDLCPMYCAKALYSNENGVFDRISNRFTKTE